MENAGGRVAAAILLMLTMVGAMATYLDDAGFGRTEWPAPISVAALIGFVVGWRQLGPSLGRGFGPSGLYGLGAALVSLVIFAALYGARSAGADQMREPFADVADAIAYGARAGFSVFEAAFLSRRTLAALVVGAISSGILSEFVGRITR